MLYLTVCCHFGQPIDEIVESFACGPLTILVSRAINQTLPLLSTERTRHSSPWQLPLIERKLNLYNGRSF
jgi:hypothetical protein